MPIYEFLCDKCGNKFEVLCTIGKEKGISCGECGSKEIRKLLSSFGIGGGSIRLRSSSPACSSCVTKSCSTCK